MDLSTNTEESAWTRTEGWVPPSAFPLPPFPSHNQSTSTHEHSTVKSTGILPTLGAATAGGVKYAGLSISTWIILGILLIILIGLGIWWWIRRKKKEEPEDSLISSRTSTVQQQPKKELPVSTRMAQPAPAVMPQSIPRIPPQQEIPPSTPLSQPFVPRTMPSQTMPSQTTMPTHSANPFSGDRMVEQEGEEDDSMFAPL
jgi:hypothetical protein